MGISKGCVFYGQSYSPILTGFPVKANILIDQTGNARLADFGLITIRSDSSSCGQGGTVRWMSPELLSPQEFGFTKSHSTKSSDCYALGMVIYETISGNPPFYELTTHAVLSKVLDGVRPPRGMKFTESLWKTLELCWAPQPNDRPGIEDVLQRLERASNSLEEPSPVVDDEMEEDSNGRDPASSSSDLSYQSSTHPPSLDTQ